MIFQENFKQFAVISFARFMSNSDTVNAFREQFHDDMPQPQSMQQNQSSQEYEMLVEQNM